MQHKQPWNVFKHFQTNPWNTVSKAWYLIWLFLNELICVTIYISQSHGSHWAYHIISWRPQVTPHHRMTATGHTTSPHDSHKSLIPHHLMTRPQVIDTTSPHDNHGSYHITLWQPRVRHITSPHDGHGSRISHHRVKVTSCMKWNALFVSYLYRVWVLGFSMHWSEIPYLCRGWVIGFSMHWSTIIYLCHICVGVGW